METKTIKTNSKEFNKKIYQYILDAIDSDAYGINTLTDTDKLQFIWDTFKSEWYYEGALNRHKTWQACFAYWISGLPTVFNIAFENNEILELAENWQSLEKDATETKRLRVINNWFNLVAFKTFQLMDKHGIKRN